MLCKGTDSLLKVSCALTEPRYLLPVPADNWSKLSKNFGALFLAWNPNVVVRCSPENDLLPGVFNRLDIFWAAICCYDPGFQTVTGNHNTGVICVNQFRGNQTFQMIYVAGYRGAMSIAGQCNRAGYRVAIQRVQTFSVRTYSGVTAAMGWLFFPGDITIHLDDQEIQRRLDTVHKLLFDGGMIYAPFPNTFPAILVPANYIGFWLQWIKIVALSGDCINNSLEDDKVCWTLADNSNIFHSGVGTPPSLPLIQSRDRGWPSLISSWETRIRLICA